MRKSGEVGDLSNLTRAELLWLVRHRAPDNVTDLSGHRVPRGWLISHPTLARLEREGATMLVNYWLERGLLVVA